MQHMFTGDAMNLREWLFKNRMRLIYFAALMKVDRTYVHKWMRGTHAPSEKVMKRIREISLGTISTHDDLRDTDILKNKKLQDV